MAAAAAAAAPEDALDETLQSGLELADPEEDLGSPPTASACQTLTPSNLDGGAANGREAQPVVEDEQPGLDGTAALSEAGLLPDLLGKAAEDEDVYTNGVFIDFLRRRRSEESTSSNDLLADRARDLMESPPELNGLPSTGLATAVDGYLQAVEALNRERLVSNLLGVVRAFWQRRSPPAKPGAPGRFAERARELVELKTQAKELKSGVHRWLLRQAVIDSIALRDSLLKQTETAERRHGRLQEFWLQLHEGMGKIIVDPLERGSGDESPRQTLRPEPRNPEVKRPLPPLAKDAAKMSWKERAARTRCPAQRSAKLPAQAPCRILAREAALRPELSLSRAPAALVGAVPTRTQVNSLLHAENEEFEPMLTSFGFASTASSLGASTVPITGEEDVMQRLKKKCNRWWQDESLIKDVCDGKSALQAGALGDIPGACHKTMPARRGSLRSSASLPTLTASAGTSKPSSTAKGTLPLRGATGSPFPLTEALDPARSSSRRMLMSVGSSSLMRGFTTSVIGSLEYQGQRSSSSTAPPPETGTFVVPWKGGSAAPPAEEAMSPSRCYLRACHQSQSVPDPLPWATGCSRRIHPGGKAFGDVDLVVVEAMIQGGLRVDEIDLAGSAGLSEAALKNVLQTLLEGPHLDSLMVLSLRRCLKAGQAPLLGLMERLLAAEVGAVRLKRLDLSGVQLNVKCQLSLCAAIKEHACLENVSLADTGFGGSFSRSKGNLAQQCIDELLGSRTIHTLDLGWNCFTADVLAHLGECLEQSRTVKSLDLTSCASAMQAGDGISPLVDFIEHLSHVGSLTSLNVSLNRIDFRGALVLEDALDANAKLSNLIISHNPLGVLGIRSLLRLLGRETSGLLYFNAEGSASGKDADVKTEMQVFSATKPGGRYELDLERQYHRALLRLLYKKAERLKLSPEDAFRDVVASPPYSHPSKDEDGVYRVSTTGKVALSFSVEKAVERDLGSIDEANYSLYLDRHLQMVRIPIQKKKQLALLAKWARSDSSVDEQRAFLDAMCKDFRLTYPQYEQMSRTHGMVVDVATRMIPCLIGVQGRDFMACSTIPSLLDYVKVLAKTRSLMALNLENPTGRYKLDLSNASNYAVVEQLSILDEWECILQRRWQRPNTSQKGDQYLSQARNVKYQEEALEISLSEWHIPEVDVAELDYVSAKRPPAGAVALDDATFRQLLVALLMDGEGLHAGIRLTALHFSSHEFYIDARQLRQLLSHFREGQFRSDCLVAIFNRVVDLHNEKAVRGLFSPVEVAQLRSRLGQALFFPFLQPEGCHFSLDLANWDERLAGSILAQLAAKEKKTNLQDCTITLADGSVDSFPTTPKNWEIPEKMPKVGVLSVDYMCEPKDRSFKLRKELLEQFACWTMEIAEEESMTWWSVFHGVPEDVIAFVCFLASTYENLEQAFDAIYEGEEKGNLSGSMFYDSMRRVGCLKFAGLEEEGRIAAVFEWMALGGEHKVANSSPAKEVPKEQFVGLFEGLWAELHHQLRDFVSFCERAHKGDLLAAWKKLDAKGKGRVAAAGWCTAVEQQGYYAPVMPIFHYLDRDATGAIGADDFAALQRGLSEGRVFAS